MTSGLTIDRQSAYDLVQKALVDRKDVLGYRTYGGPEGEGVESEEEIDFMVELADDALTGRQPGVLEHLLRWPALGRMDETTEALLVALGLVPAALLTIAEVLGPNAIVRVVDADRHVRVESMGATSGSMGWAISLAAAEDAPTWQSTGTVRVPPMPDTLIAAAAGKPLDAFLSHPVLDRFPFVVASATADMIDGTHVDTLLRVEVLANRSRDDMMRSLRDATAKAA